MEIFQTLWTYLTTPSDGLTSFTATLEIILTHLYFLIFGTPYRFACNIPLIRILIVLIISLVVLIIYWIIKELKTIIFSNVLNKHNKLIILVNSLVAIFTIGAQIYLIYFYHNILPLSIILLSLIISFSYFFISIFSLLKTSKLELTNQDLEQERDYNTTLKLLYDDVRTFRHDFGNIVQAIGGYIDTDNMNGLREYYQQLQIDCEDIKSLEALSPETIDNPAIYSILSAKYQKAASLGISMSIHISLKLSDLNMKIYEFTRILGILLDNAIEASENCEEKIINLEIRRDEKSPRQLLLIQNTYSNHNIDLNRLREKGYTSKKTNDKSHGLGLWEVDKILNRTKNSNLFTTKDFIFFTQQLEIYDK